MWDERLDLASCFTLSNLMTAADECYRGVRWKRQPQGFMARKLTECVRLRDEILSGGYRPRPVERFRIVERGKPRDVKPVAYRDRVAQRCFCDQVLIPVAVEMVTDECSAVLPGRGLCSGSQARGSGLRSYAAFERVRAHAAACPDGWWVGRYDFSSYFATIPHATLLRMLAPHVGDPGLMAFLAAVIDDDGEGGVGLELGSHVSQLCATLYPTPLDRHVMALPGITGYHRYMDDGIVFADSLGAARLAMSEAAACARALGLTVNPKKTNVNPITQPFTFCKMRFSRPADGTVRMNVRKQQARRSVAHARRVMALARGRPGLGIDAAPTLVALEGYLSRGDADLTRLVKGLEEGCRQTD